jgi:hypothetical protein
MYSQTNPGILQSIRRRWKQARKYRDDKPRRLGKATQETVQNEVSDLVKVCV